jgi:hypothetical protein
MAVKITDADGAKINLKSSTDNGEAVVHHNIDKLPGTSEADIAAIKTAVEILDNAISGSEMQVDIATIAQPAAIYTGRLTLAATGVAEALGASQELKVGVTVKALAANSSAVDVGGSGAVADSAFPLAPNEETLITIDDLSKIYVVGTAGDGVAYHAE